MKAIDIPAIRGYMGSIVYYTATFTFKQIAERVNPIDEELYTSSSLRDQIQRSLTKNYVSIKKYILTQKEHFFNALVLAIYDGDPTWNELELDFKGIDYYSMGFLRLNGEEKIFPVDGQHRVKGIKEAIKENPELEDEAITVIFIGHHNDKEGKEKTRRIFSTLNRYAKPVKPGDIIALDEDDTVAIVTRNLLESYPLFINDNVKADLKGSKALSDNDTKSFTSLLTLYDTNRIIYTYYKSRNNSQGKLYSSTKISEFLKFRPEQEELDAFEEYLRHFWNLFCDIFPRMGDYISASDDQTAAYRFRNKKDGGLLYFRPVALPQLIKAIFETKIRTGIELSNCMLKYAQLEMCISKEPWLNILWDNRTKTMIMKYKKIIFHILINMYDRSLLTDKEKDTLAKNYAEANEIDKKDAIIELNL
ncbi:MAG: DGQHR domain-containing protein [Prevotella sp.]|nr:DGQHR domain-containing protein [Prevotella sp.]